MIPALGRSLWALPAMAGTSSVPQTHTPGTGVISAPRGLPVCTERPLNHEAKALQPLFAEHLLLC